MNRRSFIKFAATAIASLFVKPQQVDPEWRFAPMVFDESERKIYMGDDLAGFDLGPIELDGLEGSWEYYVSLEEPFRFETGCGDPANWTTPQPGPVEVTSYINRHFFCVRWDANGERYELDGLPISKEEMEELLEVKLNLDFPEGTFLGWTV